MDWDSVVFTDEKKYNLDGPDGMNCYWNYFKASPEMFGIRQQGVHR